MPPNMHVWSDDRVAELKRYYDEGLSHREIGAAMGVSRNTICGKVAREKFPPRGERLSEDQLKQRRLERATQRAERHQQRRQQQPGSRPPVERPVIAPFVGSLEIAFCDLRPFSTQHSNECRHIAGEPPGPDYLACGNPTPDGKSYCVFHDAALHHQPLTLSDIERQRRAHSLARSLNAAVVKQTGPREASA